MILTKDKLSKLESLNDFKEINTRYPISEVLEINGKIFLHFDRDTFYGKDETTPTNYIHAGDYALYKSGEGIVSSSIFDTLVISNDEMERYIKTSSNVEVIGSKFESFVSILEQENKWVTNEQKLDTYKNDIRDTIKEFEQSEPYMQHTLAEKTDNKNPLNGASKAINEKTTKEYYIKRAIISALEKINSITKQDMEKNLNEEKAQEEKEKTNKINEYIKDLDKYSNKVSLIIENKDVPTIKEICYVISEANKDFEMFKYKESYIKNNKEVQEAKKKYEITVNKAVEVLNEKVDEYNKTSNDEKLPHLETKENALEYMIDNFWNTDDDFDDFNDDVESK